MKPDTIQPIDIVYFAVSVVALVVACFLFAS
jgi:hypothetical protein